MAINDVSHALVNVVLRLGGITVGQCSHFVFHGINDTKMN